MPPHSLYSLLTSRSTHNLYSLLPSPSSENVKTFTLPVFISKLNLEPGGEGVPCPFLIFRNGCGPLFSQLINPLPQILRVMLVLEIFFCREYVAVCLGHSSGEMLHTYQVLFYGYVYY